MADSLVAVLRVVELVADGVLGAYARLTGSSRDDEQSTGDESDASE